MTYRPETGRSNGQLSADIAEILNPDDDLVLSVSGTERLRLKKSGGVHVQTTLPVVSHQNSTFTTPAGSPAFDVDGYGNVLIGPNRLIDVTPGANLVFPSLAWLAAEGKLFSQGGFVAEEFGDTPDWASHRNGNATTVLAESVTLPQATIYLAYAGAAFLAAGRLNVGNDTIAYSGLSLAASTTVAGAQTIQRDTAADLAVVDTTGLRPGPAVARVGEHWVSYTALTATKIQSAQLYKSGAVTTYAAPSGATVSQHKFTGCTSGSGSPSWGDTIEQADVYPTPPSRANVAGLRGDGTLLGRFLAAPARNIPGVPPGSDPTPGFAGLSGWIAPYAAEHPRDNRTGGGIVIATTPVGTGDGLNRVDITHDGSLRLDASNKIGPNGLTRPSVAKLQITNDTPGWRTALFRAAPQQTKPIIEAQDAAGIPVLTVDTDGTTEFFGNARLRTVGAATPTGGSDGDVVKGDGCLWVNDRGTWKKTTLT